MERLTEPAIIQDIFATGRLAPEDLGNGCLRFTFFVKQRALDGSSEECIVVARLIIPADTVAALIPSTMKALGRTCCGTGRVLAVH